MLVPHLSIPILYFLLQQHFLWHYLTQGIHYWPPAQHRIETHSLFLLYWLICLFLYFPERGPCLNASLGAH